MNRFYSLISHKLSVTWGVWDNVTPVWGYAPFLGRLWMTSTAAWNRLWWSTTGSAIAGTGMTLDLFNPAGGTSATAVERAHKHSSSRKSQKREWNQKVTSHYTHFDLCHTKHWIPFTLFACDRLIYLTKQDFRSTPLKSRFSRGSADRSLQNVDRPVAAFLLIVSLQHGSDCQTESWTVTHFKILSLIWTFFVGHSVPQRLNPSPGSYFPVTLSLLSLGH